MSDEYLHKQLDALVTRYFFSGVGISLLSPALRYIALSRRGWSGHDAIYIAEYPDGRIVRQAMGLDSDAMEWHSIFKEDVSKDTFEKYMNQVSRMDFLSLTHPKDSNFSSIDSHDFVGIKRDPNQQWEFYGIESWAINGCPWYGDFIDILLDYPGSEHFFHS